MISRISIFTSILYFFIFFYSCNSNDEKLGLNHLANETSPYLLKHASNPIDWYPWNEAALEKAKSENKLMAISIGYFSCHWCQVMEEETFTDTLVANVMNRSFVSVKVDREERPDIDAIYTAAAEAMIGSSGWPLNVIATPEGKPLFIGTYFENEEWLSIVERAAYLFEDNPEQLKTDADKLSKELATKRSNEALAKVETSALGVGIMNNLDMEYGGLNTEQKFPNAPFLNSMLDLTFYHKNTELDKEIKHYLDQLVYGGVNDHLNGGFFRYSTDREWKVPHFEKMLYDNAQMIAVLSRAYQKYQDPSYLKFANQTLQFLNNEFKSSEGLYYSSSNAVSDLEEGKYYTFTINELSELNVSMSTQTLFNLNEEGNWENGKNVLYTSAENQKEYQEWLQSSDFGLLKKKQQERSKPELDKKTLSSWNAMLVKGILELYKVTGDTKHFTDGLEIMDKLISMRVKDDFTIQRQSKDEEVIFLEDYAFMIDALIESYQVSLKEEYLEMAKRLSQKAITEFYKNESFQLSSEQNIGSGFIPTSNDLSIPSGNALMALNLIKLATYYYDYHADWKDISEALLSLEAQGINKNPVFKGMWIQGLLEMTNEPYEIAILGDEANAIAYQFQSKAFRPDLLYLGGNKEGEIPLLKNKFSEGRTMIYVCQNKACKLPTQDFETAYELTLSN